MVVVVMVVVLVLVGRKITSMPCSTSCSFLGHCRHCRKRCGDGGNDNDDDDDGSDDEGIDEEEGEATHAVLNYLSFWTRRTLPS